MTKCQAETENEEKYFFLTLLFFLCDCADKERKVTKRKKIGAYQKGSDPRVDQAIMIKPYIDEFTVQGMKDIVPYKASLQGLEQLSMILIQDAQQKVNAMQQGGQVVQANNQAVAPKQGAQVALRSTNGNAGASIRPSVRAQ